MQWINIKDKRPLVGQFVTFVSVQEGWSTYPAVGKWTGEITLGESLVMDYGENDDFYSCTHWIPIPDTRDLL